MSVPASPEDIFYVPRRWSPGTHGSRCFFYDVFVSHASGDGSEHLVDALRESGVRVWYDASQVMDDRLWATRIVWGFQCSRSVWDSPDLVDGLVMLPEFFVRTRPG